MQNYSEIVKDKTGHIVIWGDKSEQPEIFDNGESFEAVLSYVKTDRRYLKNKGACVLKYTKSYEIYQETKEVIHFNYAKL